jgi:antitoxin ParD1/3/4
MSVERITTSIPQSQHRFIELYCEDTKKGKSKVIQEAIALLQEKYLGRCYKLANTEVQEDFEVTVSDGVDNESW